VEVFDGTETNADAFIRSIHNTVGTRGLRYAVDAVGGDTGSAVVRSLGPAGRMLAFGTLSGQPLQFSPRTLMTAGSSVEGFWLGNFMSQKGLLFRLNLVRRLTRLIQAGVLSSGVAQECTLDRITDAVRSAEDSSLPGKTILRIADS